MLLKVRENDLPGARSADSVPSSNLTWWTVPSVSLLVHVTVSPAAALTLSGVNAKSLMVTVFVAAAA